jgi:hypothetical protein
VEGASFIAKRFVARLDSEMENPHILDIGHLLQFFDDLLTHLQEFLIQEVCPGDKGHQKEGTNSKEEGKF